MLGLYLIAAHMLGDFVFQTRWQAVGKFGFDLHSRALRTRHVATYTAMFIPVALATASSREHAVVFLGALYLLHWLTDSRRFRSTLGDVLSWGMTPQTRPVEIVRQPWPTLPPNPWQPAAILIDQALHVFQLAVLGGIFLT